PGLDFAAAFFACLYAGAPAVPASPPGSKRSLPRLQAVSRDARPVAVLTTSGVLARTAGWFDHSADLPEMRWITVDGLQEEPAAGWEPSEPAGDDVAFLQYTSGSTATPKGVMVSHANLIHNQAVIRDACRHSERSVFVSWLPLFHDLGLIGNFLQAAFVGAPCVLMAPAAFLVRPLRWLQAVSQHGATTSGGPDFAYDLCVRRISPEQRERLDLGRWEVAFNGAEPVRSATLQRFAEAFAPCGFRAGAFFPCYGLAEATLMVSGGTPEEPPVVRAFTAEGLERGEAVTPQGETEGRTLVGCGAALGGQKVAVVEAISGERLSPGRIGEIWIAGSSVARGYWGRLEETAETFGARTADGEGPFLRTGDLGFFHEGELFVAGRLKDLIILRGRNFYPQDVEAAAESSLSGLAAGSAAAFSVESDGEERLTVVLELPRRPSLPFPDTETIAARVRAAVAEELEAHVHEVALLAPGSLPRTSSGKVQRRLCRARLLDGSLEVRGRSMVQQQAFGEVQEAGLGREPLLALPEGERRPALERWLRGRLARALRILPSRLDSSTLLAALGLDSLAAMEVKGAVEEEFGLSIALNELLEGATLDGLTDGLLRDLAAAKPGLAPVRLERVDAPEIPLSHLQEALWFLQQLAPESSAYHVIFAARLDKEVDPEALRRAFDCVVDRHAALRVTFHDDGGRPVQRRGQTVVLLRQVDATDWSDERLLASLEEEAHRPFDLVRGPVLRAVLFRRSGGGSTFLLAVHHLVFDGWSLWQFLGELGLFYSTARKGVLAELPPLRHGYPEFVSWQSALLASGEGERLWERWQARLAGIAPLELPADLPRKPSAVRPGGSYAFCIGADRVRALRTLAARSGTTLFAVVLAAYEVLLFRYTGQEQFLIGVAASGRSRLGFEAVIGCFFNVVPVPAAPGPALTFVEHLRRVSRAARESMALQDFPSHLMAERLRSGDSGLFQATFVWQKPQRLDGAAVDLDRDGRRLSVPGLELEPLPIRRNFARQELELEVIEAGESLSASFLYDAGLFRATTVARAASHLESLLDAACADPGARLADLPLLAAAEEHLLRIELSGAGEPADAPQAGSVVDLFTEQVRRNPDHPAAVHPERELTYGQLDRRSDELAALLRSVGA
ncbi:MAG TPA: condensation domain-containing protein, partial [Thermoanaerobaculia bacterium]|nr:condensation domain-containing protein [Thermoanaerobaculia bacterium]